METRYKDLVEKNPEFDMSQTRVLKQSRNFVLFAQDSGKFRKHYAVYRNGVCVYESHKKTDCVQEFNFLKNGGRYENKNGLRYKVY